VKEPTPQRLQRWESAKLLLDRKLAEYRQQKEILYEQKKSLLRWVGAIVLSVICMPLTLFVLYTGPGWHDPANWVMVTMFHGFVFIGWLNSRRKVKKESRHLERLEDQLRSVGVIPTTKP
jgi:UDP-N-acetylmuramyl pentapeptide phosphotransferase/UDP-N-acetylglucosamine-1-phosphate transferase